MAGIPKVAGAQVAADSINVVQHQYLDSFIQTDTGFPDSLIACLSEVDSIRTVFNTSADSLQHQYKKVIGGIDRHADKLNQKIDSLRKMNLTTSKYERSLKKLSDLHERTEGQYSTKLNALKSKTTDKLNALDLPPEYKEPLQKLTTQIDGLDINNEVVKIPELKIPGYDLSNVNGIGECLR